MKKPQQEKSPLDTILEFQEGVKAARQHVADLATAIGNQEAILSEASSFKTDLPELLAKREDLLAKMVMGKGSKEDLATLDEEISEAKQSLDEFTANSAVATTNAKHALAGLRRSLEAAKGELSSMENEKPQVLQRFLMAEAEQVGEKYAETAKLLVSKYRRLLALNQMVMAHGLRRGFSLNLSNDLLIPTFLLQAHNDLAKNHLAGQMYEAVAARVDMSVFTAVKDAEVKRIRELGIEI